MMPLPAFITEYRAIQNRFHSSLLVNGSKILLNLSSAKKSTTKTRLSLWMLTELSKFDFDLFG